MHKRQPGTVVVLRALGVNEEMAHTSVRYGLGRFTTEEEVDRAIEATMRQVEKLAKCRLSGRWFRKASI